MKRLAIIILAAVCAPLGWSQAAPISGFVVNQYGQPAAGVKVYICSAAGSSGLPCSPLANIFYDYNLTNPAPNPTTTDANGNYNVYVGPLVFPNVYVANAVTGYGTPTTQLYPGPTCLLGGCTYIAPVYGLDVVNPGVTPDNTSQLATIDNVHASSYRSALEFGALPANADNSTALQGIITYELANPGTCVHFDAGTYYYSTPLQWNPNSTAGIGNTFCLVGPNLPSTWLVYKGSSTASSNGNAAMLVNNVYSGQNYYTSVRFENIGFMALPMTITSASLSSGGLLTLNGTFTQTAIGSSQAIGLYEVGGAPAGCTVNGEQITASGSSSVITVDLSGQAACKSVTTLTVGVGTNLSYVAYALRMTQIGNPSTVDNVGVSGGYSSALQCEFCNGQMDWRNLEASAAPLPTPLISSFACNNGLTFTSGGSNGGSQAPSSQFSLTSPTVENCTGTGLNLVQGIAIVVNGMQNSSNGEDLFDTPYFSQGSVTANLYNDVQQEASYSADQVYQGSMFNEMNASGEVDLYGGVYQPLNVGIVNPGNYSVCPTTVTFSGGTYLVPASATPICTGTALTGFNYTAHGEYLASTVAGNVTATLSGGTGTGATLSVSAAALWGQRQVINEGEARHISALGGRGPVVENLELSGFTDQSLTGIQAKGNSDTSSHALFDNQSSFAAEYRVACASGHVGVYHWQHYFNDAWNGIYAIGFVNINNNGGTQAWQAHLFGSLLTSGIHGVAPALDQTIASAGSSGSMVTLSDGTTITFTIAPVAGATATAVFDGTDNIATLTSISGNIAIGQNILPTGLTNWPSLTGGLPNWYTVVAYGSYTAGATSGTVYVETAYGIPPAGTYSVTFSGGSLLATIANGGINYNTTTTAGWSSGSNQITVASSTGIGLGEYVTGANIATGSQVTALSGTLVTLSMNTTGSGSGTTVQFGVPAGINGPLDIEFTYQPDCGANPSPTEYAIETDGNNGGVTLYTPSGGAVSRVGNTHPALEMYSLSTSDTNYYDSGWALNGYSVGSYMTTSPLALNFDFYNAGSKVGTVSLGALGIAALGALFGDSSVNSLSIAPVTDAGIIPEYLSFGAQQSGSGNLFTSGYLASGYVPGSTPIAGTGAAEFLYGGLIDNSGNVTRDAVILRGSNLNCANPSDQNFMVDSYGNVGIGNCNMNYAPATQTPDPADADLYIHAGVGAVEKHTMSATLLLPTTIYSHAGTQLASCASSIVGAEAVVSDATALTPGTAYSVTAGAGSDTVRVQCTLTGSTYNWQTM